MKRQHSVPIQLIRSLLIAPRKRAVDLEVVCAHAGLEHWLDLIETDDDSTRFPLEELGVFLITLWRYMEDEAGGFLSHRLKLGTFSMMCHALISAPNLRRGLLRSARYIALLTDDLRLTLEEEGDEARFVFAWDNPLGEDEVFFITSMFVIWIRLSCWMIDRPMLLDRVDFQFDEPSYSDEFSLMFPCALNFGAERNVFAFNKRMLGLPIKQDPHSLVNFLSHAPQSLLTQFRADDSVTAQVKRLLIDAYAKSSTLSFDDTSEHLNTTTHTLRRRLKEEGHSFQEIKDSVRRERAFLLLKTSDISVNQLSELLGFSEPAAFIRAFKKWSGQSPTAFRSPKSESH
ncbi:MAG: AraC family transcriptional regulator [Oleiphilaceae bacterium]|nr:AraC family transcriptional regulator [Oleiphilaceae bacterium]